MEFITQWEKKKDVNEQINQFISNLINSIMKINQAKKELLVNFSQKERDTYFKELAHIIVEVGKSKIYGVSQHTGDPGKSNNLSPKALCWQNSFFLQGCRSFFLLRSSTNQMRSTHIKEDKLLYSKFTDLNFNLISKYLLGHLEWCLTKYVNTMSQLS